MFYIGVHGTTPLSTIRSLQNRSAPNQPSQIRRLPHNKRCVNCDKESIAGHGDVCAKFQTFVCHTCKSAHQSFSHRCKSISLSHWTPAEVNQLSDQAGGGNAITRLTWLGKLEGRLTLRPDDPLDKVKAFVNDAYNHHRYWKEMEASWTSSPVAATESPGPVSRGFESAPSTQQQQQRVGNFTTTFTKPASVAPGTDFLDFDADFTQATPPAADLSQRHPNASPPSGGASDFAFMNQTGQGNTISDFIGSAATRAFSSFSPLPTGPGPQADDWQHFGAFVAASPVPGAAPAFATPAVAPASNSKTRTNSSSAFAFMGAGPSTAAPPNHDGFGDFAADAPPPPPNPTHGQQPLTCTAPPPRPAPPAMMLTRPLIEGPFAVLAPQQQPSFSSASSAPYMPSQQPRPRGPMPASAMMMVGGGVGFPQAYGAGYGVGGQPYAPSHLTMQPSPRPSHPQMPMMMMNGGGAPRPSPPGYGQQQQHQHQQQQQQYRSQAPDPFAGLDWRK